MKKILKKAILWIFYKARINKKMKKNNRINNNIGKNKINKKEGKNELFIFF